MAPIVFFGSSPLSTIVLEKLIGRVSAVVTPPDKPVGRHLKLTPNPVKLLALKNSIPVYTSPLTPLLNLGEGNERGEVIGLVAAYGQIIPQNILDKFNNQIFNIHPSLLPKYRGPSPLQQQILAGVTDSGVTIIQLDPQMDHGPIVAVARDTILPNDTWITLGERLFSKGAELFLTSPRVSYTPQNHKLATYTSKLTRADGFVPWEKFNPSSLGRRFRAFHPWPGIWTLDPSGKRLKLVSLNPVLVQFEGQSPKPWPIQPPPRN